MTDIVDKTTRSRMMSGIKGQDTKAELLIRKGLHNLGFRYRIHYKKLPGKPDIVFPKYKAIILINGCFWHGHHCHLFKWPSTRNEFWKTKIEGTMGRDKRNIAYYHESGWRVLVIWECALKGKTRIPIDQLLPQITSWLQFYPSSSEISGNPEVVI